VTTEFLSREIWTAIRSSAIKFQGKSFVAVAYLGKGATRRLPLKRGSLLVVDASLPAVKSGQTDPNELEKFRKRGVRVFSAADLHAKVFVFGETAYVGSTNVSANSANIYSEASIRTTQAAAVASARQFVRALAQNELGPAQIARLSKIHRSRATGFKGRAKKTESSKPRFFIVRLTESDEREDDAETIKDGVRKARRMISSKATHNVEYFWNRSKVNQYRLGDSFLVVLIDGRRRILHVEPPSAFLYSNTHNGTRYYYLEVPRKKVMSAAEFRNVLPTHLRKRINRAGRVEKEVESSFREAFR